MKPMLLYQWVQISHCLTLANWIIWLASSC